MKNDLLTPGNLLKSTLAEIEISYNPTYKVSELPMVDSSNKAYTFLKDIFPSLSYREYFYILCLSRSNKALGYSQISMGGISGTVTDVRIIMQTALKSNASAIILAHNHPSGNLQPSESDKKVTGKIKEAGQLLEITVLDHLILTSETYLSFADEGLM
ncbi:MAG: JAB domain-containing protein [Prolixibacteraceae bacterium]|jgi:DNA repair protein RadC|nr:JAB domain-containing protein [Prolixibacteraceae bacterium]